MHQKNILLITLSLLCTSASLKPYFFFLEEWSNGEQKVYFFADRHITEKESNHVYHKQVDALLAEARKQEAHFIVEDSNVVCSQLFEDPLNFGPSKYIMNTDSYTRLPESTYPFISFFRW